MLTKLPIHLQDLLRQRILNPWDRAGGKVEMAVHGTPGGSKRRCCLKAQGLQWLDTHREAR